MKRFTKKNSNLKPVFNQYFNDFEFNQLLIKLKKEIEQLIPEIPYIGGKKNGLSFNLVGSAVFLALIRILERQGLSPREIGKMCYELNEVYYNSLPKTFKWLMRKLVFMKWVQKRIKRRVTRSQLKQYPDDWVFKFVDGKNEVFNFGVNYTECGICKFYKKMGVEQYLPYLCLSDYASFRASRIGMKRTQTIGNGAPYCDFRFIKEYETQSGWPPDDLEEFNLK